MSNARKQNFQIRNLRLLEDPPPELYPINAKWPEKFPEKYILMPCSFSCDEPLEQAIEAAKLAPELMFIVTGDSSNNQSNHDLQKLPNNFQYKGYMEPADYDALVLRAGAMLALTLDEGIQLSCANEAVGAEVPMVLAATRTLQSLFYKGAIYVHPTQPTSIAEGCQRALLERARLCVEIKMLKTERWRRWREQAVRGGFCGPDALLTLTDASRASRFGQAGRVVGRSPLWAPDEPTPSPDPRDEHGRDA